MRMTRITRSVATWMAFFAILMAALAPSISHAVALAKGAPNTWVEICTVNGSKMVAVEADQTIDSSQPAKQVTHVEHCPFCMPHAAAIGVLPSVDFVMPVLTGEHILPPLYYHASHSLFAWATANPRAPPALS